MCFDAKTLSILFGGESLASGLVWGGQDPRRGGTGARQSRDILHFLLLVLGMILAILVLRGGPFFPSERGSREGGRRRTRRWRRSGEEEEEGEGRQGGAGGAGGGVRLRVSLSSYPPASAFFAPAFFHQSLLQSSTGDEWQWREPAKTG